MNEQLPSVAGAAALYARFAVSAPTECGGAPPHTVVRINSRCLN